MDKEREAPARGLLLKEDASSAHWAVTENKKHVYKASNKYGLVILLLCCRFMRPGKEERLPPWSPPTEALSRCCPFQAKKFTHSSIQSVTRHRID